MRWGQRTTCGSQFSFQRLSSVMRVGTKAFTPVSEPTCQAYAQPFKDSMRF